MRSVTSLKPRPKREPSFAQLSKALTEPDLPLTSSQRAVALVIFQHVRMTDMKCWPSVETIRRRAKASKNTVYSTIKILQEIGLMTVQKQRTQGKFARNVYDFSNTKSRIYHVPIHRRGVAVYGDRDTK